MRDFFRSIRERASRAWARIRSWFIGLLIALGVVGGMAFAATQNFSWTNPTRNEPTPAQIAAGEPGDPFDPATELAEIRIYCNVSPTTFVSEVPGTPASNTPVLISPGDLTSAARDFAAGDYTCFATAFSIYGYESAPSNTVTFSVDPTVAPEPPVLTLGPQT